MKKFVLFGAVIGILSMFLFTSSTFAADGSTTTTSSSTTVSNLCAKNDLTNVTGVVNWASCFLYKSIMPLLFALATAGFIWGIVQFYLNPDNEEKRKKGKSFIVGGLIALFIMVSMWGIVGIFTKTFNFGNTIPQLPQ